MELSNALSESRGVDAGIATYEEYTVNWGSERSQCGMEARGKVEIWVQMQVSFFTLLNQKPTGKNKTIIKNGTPQTAT